MIEALIIGGPWRTYNWRALGGLIIGGTRCFGLLIGKTGFKRPQDLCLLKTPYPMRPKGASQNCWYLYAAHRATGWEP